MAGAMRVTVFVGCVSLVVVAGDLWHLAVQLLIVLIAAIQALLGEPDGTRHVVFELSRATDWLRLTGLTAIAITIATGGLGALSEYLTRKEPAFWALFGVPPVATLLITVWVLGIHGFVDVPFWASSAGLVIAQASAAIVVVWSALWLRRASLMPLLVFFAVAYAVLFPITKPFVQDTGAQVARFVSRYQRPEIVRQEPNSSVAEDYCDLCD
jgi:hypothetical protein